jgi:hypothetical protein
VGGEQFQLTPHVLWWARVGTALTLASSLLYLLEAMAAVPPPSLFYLALFSSSCLLSVLFAHPSSQVWLDPSARTLGPAWSFCLHGAAVFM